MLLDKCPVHWSKPAELLPEASTAVTDTVCVRRDRIVLAAANTMRLSESARRTETPSLIPIPSPRTQCGLSLVTSPSVPLLCWSRDQPSLDAALILSWSFDLRDTDGQADGAASTYNSSTFKNVRQRHLKQGVVPLSKEFALTITLIAGCTMLTAQHLHSSDDNLGRRRFQNILVFSSTAILVFLWPSNGLCYDSMIPQAKTLFDVGVITAVTVKVRICSIGKYGWWILATAIILCPVTLGIQTAYNGLFEESILIELSTMIPTHIFVNCSLAFHYISFYVMENSFSKILVVLPFYQTCNCLPLHTT